MSEPTLADVAAILERVEAVVVALAQRPAQDCAQADALARRMDAYEARERARARRWWLPVSCSLLAGVIGGVIGYLLGAG